ncbi:6-phosphofructo-2-kinase/fructose-2,6-bisphosphatase 1 isoform X1 [Bombus vancouverensis nearcticus]|uniref:6-phosphofructo-2-kinase/fructose-2, 6-bisphosphatase 1 isoform X1 n=1 Tax=Bombus impatiens TaxID=132113 RepID=A0A6P3UNW8_BOMIM|nr:6-phosphofructo-2-kinase/fructose-2,6-bisphosphatase 1 isoform X1 [Bombus impatiens]XP_033182854.1 6-phosphofructo-2-kinase/fructose-2,6-bisphosphatase 1-like isoform X1 [Bombus vancouverensis nearcticus]
MPWVAACLDLLAAPILGYCLAVRKLALQAGFFQEETNKPIITQTVNATNTSTIQKETSSCADTMAPSVEEQRQEPKDKITVRTSGIMKSPRKFSGVVIAMCGLPGRGKSQVAQCLSRRLNWNGESTKVMRVSDYRRKRLEPYGEAVSHELFLPDHTTNAALRALAQRDAMHECATWLAGGNSVAILDATLVMRAQRAEVFDYFSGQLGYRVLFIECVCNDPVVLERNYKEILRYSADYVGMDSITAEEDLRLKIAHYIRSYEPMDEKTYPRIRIDTGSMDIESCNVSGHVETNVLGYLGSVTVEPHTLYFSRHGESEYNVLGKVGGDAVLSARGERYAQALATKFNAMRIPDLRVLTSRLRRTIATARGVEAPQEHVAALNELHAGICEGLSYEEMQEHYPQEFAWRDQDKLRYRYPWGESYIDAMHRVEPVIAELQRSNNILVVSHQAILRCIIGFFTDKKPEEVPYAEVPLHTIIRVSSQGYNYKVDFFKLPIECVNTTRVKPNNCSADRTADDALLTVPAHFDIPDPWRNLGSGPTLVQQH